MKKLVFANCSVCGVTTKLGEVGPREYKRYWAKPPEGFRYTCRACCRRPCFCGACGDCQARRLTPERRA